MVVDIGAHRVTPARGGTDNDDHLHVLDEARSECRLRRHDRCMPNDLLPVVLELRQLRYNVRVL